MRRIAGFPCGRWTKWAVLAFWIAVVVAAGPLAGKLNSAQQNDASEWLPNNAESTKLVELAKRFVPSDTTPAVVLYEPAGPITGPQRARAAADAERFAGLDHVGGKVVGPIAAADGRALQVVVPIKMGYAARAAAARRTWGRGCLSPWSAGPTPPTARNVPRRCRWPCWWSWRR